MINQFNTGPQWRRFSVRLHLPGFDRLESRNYRTRKSFHLRACRKIMIVSLQEAQAKLPELIYNLKPGEELLITDNNLPLAKLIGQTPTSPQRPGPGLCKGMITIVADDEEHLQDFAEYLH